MMGTFADKTCIAFPGLPALLFFRNKAASRLDWSVHVAFLHIASDFACSKDPLLNQSPQKNDLGGAAGNQKQPLNDGLSDELLANSLVDCGMARFTGQHNAKTEGAKVATQTIVTRENKARRAKGAESIEALAQLQLLLLNAPFASRAPSGIRPQNWSPQNRGPEDRECRMVSCSPSVCCCAR